MADVTPMVVTPVVVTPVVVMAVVVMAASVITIASKGCHVIPHVMDRRLQAMQGRPNVADIAVRVANANIR